MGSIHEQRTREVFKRCVCGCSYTYAEWLRLERRGTMRVGDVELELRQCACRSTLAIQAATERRSS